MPLEADQRRDILLLPWLTIDEPLELLGFRFVSWSAREISAEVEPVLLPSLAAICATYRDQKGAPLQTLTLAFRVGDRDHSQPTDVELGRASWARLALAMSSLSARQFYRQAGAYCNAAHFAIYGHAVTDGIAIRTRRRDGRDLAGWPLGSLKLACALQASPIVLRSGNAGAPADLRIDFDLLRLIERLAIRGDEFARCARAAIDLFLTANTDAEFEDDEHDVRLLVTAIEGLLRRGTQIRRAGEFATAVEEALGLVRYNTRKDAPCWQTVDQSRPYWRDERTGYQKPWSETEAGFEIKRFSVVGLWAYEIYRLRSELNHGDNVHSRAWCWSAFEHALFASWLFPRLLRNECSRKSDDSPDGFRDRTASRSTARLRVREWARTHGGTSQSEWDWIESHVEFEKIAQDVLRRLRNM